MEPVKVAKVVNFTCGCISEYVYLGNQAGEKDWHVVPCVLCARSRKQGALEERAEQAWDKNTPRIGK